MRKPAFIIAILIIALLAIFIWPTQWRYTEIRDVPFREHRFTGEVQRFYPSEGWRKIESAKPALLDSLE